MGISTERPYLDSDHGLEPHFVVVPGEQVHVPKAHQEALDASLIESIRSVD